MLKMGNETRTDLTIRLGGENEINVLEYTNFLKSIHNSIGSICNIYQKNMYFKMNVIGTKQGSFLIELNAISIPALTLTGIVTAGTAIKLYLEILKIIKDLRGKPAKKVDPQNSTIINHYGDVNIYSVEAVNTFASRPDLVQDIKQNISKIKNRESVRFYSKKENIEMEMSNKEMNELIEEIEDNNEENQFFEKEKIKLIGVILVGKAKWTVNFRNEIIKVSISDKNYLEKIQNGLLSLNAKDKITVDLLKITEFNNDKIYEKYYITRVYE